MSTDKSETAHLHHSIAKSAGIISLATLCSRLLGFLRDMVIARLFGVYIYAQAFVVAFKIPNLFRDLLGEGAGNAAFVPVFKEYLIKRNKEEFWELANIILNFLLVILMTVTLIGILAAPFVIKIIAPGFSATADKLEVTVRLTRIVFPYLILICLAAYATAILNTLNHFSIPAFAPCLLNISIIICAMLWGEGIKGLALGVLIGGVLQLLIQLPLLYKKGFRYRFTGFGKSIRNHRGVKNIGKLMLPRLFSSAVYQLNNFVDSIFGSFVFIVGEGGVAVLYFAYRIVQLPIGIFSNAVAQVMLPAFSKQVLEEGYQKVAHTLSFGLRAIFFVMIPVSVCFMVLSKQVISALFSGGKFDAYACGITSDVLLFYSIGLFAYGATKIINSCFFAMKDTVTPAKISSLTLVLNIVFNSILMFPLRLNGVALATSISGIAAFFISLYILNKRLGILNIREISVSFLRISLASICMGIVCHFIDTNLTLVYKGFGGKYVSLAISLLMAVMYYIVFCFIFRVKEARELLLRVKHGAR